MAAWLAVALATGLGGPWVLTPAQFPGGTPLAVAWVASQDAPQVDHGPPAVSRPGVHQPAGPKQAGAQQARPGQSGSRQSGPRQAVALQCRRAPGPWQTCRLTIVSLGRHWWLQVGPERWVLRADGRGTLTLQEGRGPARPVQPLWQADRSLCWNGHCIKGDFPLD